LFVGKTRYQLGSGTCLQVGAEKFVVTAAHVWHQAKGFETELFVTDIAALADDRVEFRQVPFSGRCLRMEDPVDVAILELHEPTASEMSNRRFIRFVDTALEARPPGWCMLFGFPVETTVERCDLNEVRYRPFFFGSLFYSGDSALEGHHADLHFLLDASGREELLTLKGEPASLPRRLNGISGCGVWQVLWPGDNPEKGYDAEKTRAVGVQTAYYDASGLIRATHWGAVANLLARARPELRPAVELSFRMTV
jgi:hypothetical protein